MDWLKEQRTSDDINVQGSEAWKKWRGKGLGSSDAAVLLGWSPWKTIKQLFEEKTGIWTPSFGAFQQAAMDRGKELEPKIRKWYETEYRKGVAFKENIAENGVFRASFDGINELFTNPEDGSVGRIIEIKAPNAADHALAKEGMVPQKYIPQVQWLMLVGKIEWCDYVSFGSDGTYAIVPIRFDEVIQTELVKRASMFWKFVEMEKIDFEEFEYLSTKWEYPLKPIDLGESDKDEIQDDIDEMLRLQNEINTAEARITVLKEKFKSYLGDKQKMQLGEVTFGYQERKGTIKYGDIPELKQIDLDKYRSDSIKVFYFKKGEKK